MIERRLYNFRGYAIELHSYIKYRLPSNHPVPDSVMINAALDLILNLIRSMIFLNGEKAINYPAYDDTEAYVSYAATCMLDPKQVEEVLCESIMLDNLTTEIYQIISKNTWGLYAVDSMTFECFGDWRILQWEKEHLDDRGRYVIRKSDAGH